MSDPKKDTERQDGVFREGLFVPAGENVDPAAEEDGDGAPNSRLPSGGSVEPDRLDDPVNASIPPGGTYA